MSSFLPGTMTMLILRTLQVGPLHGYAIGQAIRESSRNRLAVEDGSLYPALTRMVAKGWLRGHWDQSETKRKARIYRITPSGRKAADRLTAEFLQLVKGITEVLKRS